jgi:hypothetical protein
MGRAGLIAIVVGGALGIGFGVASGDSSSNAGLPHHPQGVGRSQQRVSGAVSIQIDHTGTYTWYSDDFTNPTSPGNLGIALQVHGDAVIPTYTPVMLNNHDGTYDISLSFVVQSFSGSPAVGILHANAWDGGREAPTSPTPQALTRFDRPS